MKAWELTGCMPGPPSHLHHHALLFSWVAGLITDPCWHAIARMRTRTGASEQDTHSILTFFLSIPLSHFPFFLHFILSHCHILSSFFLPPLRTFFSSLLPFFASFFLCYSVTFSSLAPGTFYLSFSVSLSPILLFFMLLSFPDILLSPLSLHSLSLCALSLVFSPSVSLSFTPTFALLSD